MIVIHSYFTEGYFPWAKLFVESFKKTNGENYRLILSTRNLDSERIKILNGLYNNIDVRNKDLDYKKLSQRAGISRQTLMNFKKETEKIKVNVGNKVWKLMIAGDERIREVREIVKELDEGDLLFHFDIDSYFRKSIDPWIDILKNNDFTTIFRIKNQMRKFGHIKRENHAICICFQGYNVSEKCIKFLDKWISKIDAVKPPNRPKGFGQTTVYHAYLEMKNELKWGDLPKTDFGLTGSKKSAIFWGANKGSKNDNLKKFKRDMK